MDFDSIRLEDHEWKRFTLKSIFDFKHGKRLTKDDMEPGNIPFIGAVESNNGITNWISNENRSLEKGVLGLNYNGSVGVAFYHPYAAVFSDDVIKLKLKERPDADPHVYLFIKTMIEHQRPRFQYGYKLNQTRLARESIMLPVNSDGNPDYDFMEQFMKERERSVVRKYLKYKGTFDDEQTLLDEYEFDNKDWKSFVLSEVFSKIQRGKRFKNEDHVTGEVPYVSSTAESNGVDDFVSIMNGVRIGEDCITIANSGSVGTCFYHPYSFVASDHVTCLYADGLDKYQYLFICVMMSRMGNRYAFNREISDSRIKNEKVMLPVDNEGNPDWDFMSRFMKNEERKMISHYIDYLNNSVR